MAGDGRHRLAVAVALERGIGVIEAGELELGGKRHGGERTRVTVAAATLTPVRTLGALVATLMLLALAGAAEARPALTYSTGSLSPTVWLANANGKQARRLGQGSEPLIAPSGSAVAATATGTKGPALLIYRPGSSTQHYFSLGKVNAVAQAWSPDSRYLAVGLDGVSTSGKGSGLAVIDTKTNKVTTIANGSDCGVSFAPRRPDRLVYAGARGSFACLNRHVNVFTVTASGAGRRQLSHDGLSLNPVWGPRSIAFDRATIRGTTEAPEYQVWLMRSDGSHLRQVTHMQIGPLAVGLVPLSFSANGNRLLTAFEGQDTSETWTIQFPSGQVHQLTIRGDSVQAGGISRDGRTVLVDFGGFEASPSHGTVATLPFGADTRSCSLSTPASRAGAAELVAHFARGMRAQRPTQGLAASSRATASVTTSA